MFLLNGPLRSIASVFRGNLTAAAKFLFTYIKTYYRGVFFSLFSSLIINSYYRIVIKSRSGHFYGCTAL